MNNSSFGNLLKASKEKDFEAFKKNWLYITQTLISSTVLAFCISYIVTGKATDQNDKIIVWSILSTIIGNYLPSAKFQNNKVNTVSPNTVSLNTVSSNTNETQPITVLTPSDNFNILEEENNTRGIKSRNNTKSVSSSSSSYNSNSISNSISNSEEKNDYESMSNSNDILSSNKKHKIKYKYKKSHNIYNI